MAIHSGSSCFRLIVVGKSKNFLNFLECQTDTAERISAVIEFFAFINKK